LETLADLLRRGGFNASAQIADECVFKTDGRGIDGDWPHAFQRRACFLRHVHERQTELVAAHDALNEPAQWWELRWLFIESQYKLLHAASKSFQRTLCAEDAVIENRNVIGHPLNVGKQVR